MRESIRFAWGSSSLGDFMVAISKNGVVAVEFSSMHSATEEALSMRFPDAEFRRSRHELADVTGLLARLIDDPTIHCELPIDLRGTAFGVRIWLMLRDTRRSDDHL
jgi:AraC family transcriptional regulator, regulatory protein of adaptative response / methylated-DNA-[protein]-cysteine methyltransferase